MWFLALFISSGAASPQTGRDAADGARAGNARLPVAGVAIVKTMEGRGISYYGGL